MKIYLKINDAERLEKDGDYRSALDDFKDCGTKLQKIHESDPNWENALVSHRLADCQAKILELEPLAANQAPSPPPVVGPASGGDTNTPSPTPPSVAVQPDSDQVAALKLQLQAVKQELQITKDQLKDSQTQLETYRVQLQAVNEQLIALKGQPIGGRQDGQADE